MKQHNPNTITILSTIVVATSLLLTACTSPTTGGNNLNNQPKTTDIITQTQLPTSPAAQNSNDATQQDTNQKSVVNPKPSSMKTLADFPPNNAKQAIIKTSKGDVVISLYRDEAPLTTINFITLASSGFYDGIVFHRIIPGFMSQVGDPLSKDPTQKERWGTSGSGYVIADEFGAGLKHDKAGVVSMANAGPNTGGSQFFITHEETPWLDGKHAIFGQVIEGMENVLKLEVGDSIIGITLQ